MPKKQRNFMNTKLFITCFVVNDRTKTTSPYKNISMPPITEVRDKYDIKN